jgi:hypothetical protein
VQNSHFIVLFYQFSQSIPVIISNNLHTVRLILPVDTETVEIFEEKWESINPFRSIFANIRSIISQFVVFSGSVPVKLESWWIFLFIIRSDPDFL